MIICDKNFSCCNWQYADRLDDIDEEFRNCDKLLEVEVVRHSKWMKTYHSGMAVSKWFVSLCCDMWNERDTNYCPYCGAKMDLK